MRQPPELSSETFDPDEIESRSLTFARLLSQIFNPVIAMIAGYVLVGLQTAEQAGLAWAGGILVMQTLPSVGYYLIRLRQGVFSDADVSVRHERNELYVVGTLSMLLMIALLATFGAPHPFIALTVGMFGLGIVCGLVNLNWKISMHGAAIGALATIALLYSNGLGVVCWACAAAVAWARIRTRNHTPAQVVAGLGVAAVIMTVSFLTLA